MKSRKKNYVAWVNAAIFRKLMGKNIKDLKLLDEKEKKFYFFTNSLNSFNQHHVLSQVRMHSKEAGNYCFGVIQMKNGKEYFFICRVDTLYIDPRTTHVHSKPKVEFSTKCDY